MSVLNKYELEKTQDFLNRGFEKAAKSFSKMTRHEVKIKPLEHFQVSASENPTASKIKTGEQLYLITTKLIGQFAGTSYLIFSPHEAEEVYNLCMPYKADEATRIMETEALLKELDNILSAAVVTEFSNYLDAMVFGDVPKLTRMNHKRIEQRILHDHFNQNKDDILLFANTEFILDKSEKLNPQFIWLLSGDFVRKLKSILVQTQAQ